ncbi:MAG: hypothetical protein ACUVQP_09275 [Bacteroidales bacterium]
MNKSIVFIALITLFITTTASRCKKETPPKAVVLVVDEEGHPMVGATVKVYSDPTLYSTNYPSVGYVDPDEKKLYDQKITDGSGKAFFEFKYESIFSVYAWYKKQISWNHYDTLKGYGALILKNNETYEEKVIVRSSAH